MLDLLTAMVWAGALWASVTRLATAWERVAMPRPVPVDPDADLTMPEDLLALALSEQDAWAQEDVQKVIWERYSDLGDWNLVRQAMGIGRMP
jgi:hypothetical protein